MSGLPMFVRGTVVGGDFVVVRPLDEGGMGAVFLVEQTSTGKPRALKVMHREIVADPHLQKRFEQEAKIGARIASDHVVDVVAAGVDAATGLPYLVMELLEGEDLRDHLDRHGAMTPERVRVVFEQLCHALAAAHAAGVVHRDLKPENVFLARSRRAGAEPLDVKVLDFGVAKLFAEVGTRATHTKGAVGSPMWMAPEQTAPGPVTPAADVWALGLVAYELFTGKTFWRTPNVEGGTTAQLFREIVLDPIPWASERAREQGREGRLPIGFDAWFARCVTREPRDRYPDAGVAWRSMQPIFTPSSAAAFAETTAAPSTDTSPPRGGETADATRFASDRVVAAGSAPAAPATLPKETPVEAVRDATPSPRPPRGGRAWIAGGAAIAAVGIAAGVVVATRRPSPPTSAPLSSASAPVAPLAAASASAPVGAPASATSASAPAPLAASVATEAPRAPRPPASASASAAPARATVGGFSDPVDRKGAVLWKVQGRHVRLFSRLVSNESNVADRVVREAVDWNSWEYLRCYERVFGGAKEMPEGVVTVGFDILDQLPRHGALVGSSIQSKAFGDCVVSTLIGQTINAAGPDGKGHAVVAFRFVPMD